MEIVRFIDTLTRRAYTATSMHVLLRSKGGVLRVKEADGTGTAVQHRSRARELLEKEGKAFHFTWREPYSKGPTVRYIALVETSTEDIAKQLGMGHSDAVKLGQLRKKHNVG